ncbi:hypothetical protein KHC33_05990 [Methanospirillum sp. J.3.6.1-F.2.7.3]|jgi:hypothetical protein|uniref:Uncharacterized protein n=2 Tax=Methanospirillum TaxID=2202 RepID=A0A8E7EI33_9EURY|nr:MULTISPECIES: hypothetical protein [Methanospirillum]MDX8549909.1 hypothetical protein [Methanospirillum hungatei]NLW75425.1 hypothetical protein [Methanomicrobiales archaeon]QVV90043.1 hypothetical protein KHC33_05990 [Methanospirillum sp. J.3.6.1-F.2.7.3]QXO94442.1 hypothetical protein KSK55_14140 [Methanospirillum hungatei]
MQEKRPNKVLGYRTDIHGEPKQTLIGPVADDRCIIFNLDSGDTSIITPGDPLLTEEPFIPCDEVTNEKIFKMMKKRPDIYVKFYKLLNERIPR